MPSGKLVYNWYISLVAASCMVLYGYDASVYNAVQGSKNWNAYFNHPVSPNPSERQTAISDNVATGH